MFSPKASEWKTPAAVMCVHRLKQKSKTEKQKTEKDCDKSIESLTCYPTDGGRKRKNPFGCSSPLKLRVLAGGKETVAGGNSDVESAVSEDDKSDGETTDHGLLLQKSEVLPVDWSLKMKLRILTRKALVSAAAVKSTSEANALADFVHNVPLDDAGTGSILASLQRCCNYWVHPSLPWFPEFPRIIVDSKIRVESFTSLYQQLMIGLCPYFYLCCHQFTVLFRGKGVGGYPQHTACLTPSTCGIREALNHSGVGFTLPNLKKETVMDSDLTNHQAVLGRPLSDSFESSQFHSIYIGSPECSSGVQHDVSDEAEDNKGISVSSDGVSLWLQTIGLDRKDFPTLEPAKVKIHQQVDRRAQSLVLCEGREVQALFNFLINFRSCIALTGPQAGIPPTILSPTVFRGATLKSNQIHQSVAKLPRGALTGECCVLEVSGPLLPHHTLNITAVLRERDIQPAIISLNTHEQSASFNLGLKTCTKNSTTSKSDGCSSNGNVEKPNMVTDPLGGEITQKSAADEERNGCGLSVAEDPVQDGTGITGGPIWEQHFKLESFVTDGEHPTRLGSGCSKVFFAQNENPVSESHVTGVKDETSHGDLSSEDSLGSLMSDAALVQPNTLHSSADAGSRRLSLGQVSVINTTDFDVFHRVRSWGNGLHRTARDQMCVNSGLNGDVLREVKCEPHGFTWS